MEKIELNSDYKDIETAFIENNLEPFKHQELQFFLWGSYKKR